MPIRMKRRRVKKRKRPGEISQVKFAGFIAIMVLAVFLGYLTAKFVIGPLLGYNADESPIKITGQDDKKNENGDGKDKSEAAASDKSGDSGKTGSSDKTDATDKSGGAAEAAEEGYALQFGVFSTKGAADEMAAELGEKGIEAKVVKDDDMYKVISPVIKTKDEAIGRLGDIKDKEVEDVFIASF